MKRVIIVFAATLGIIAGLVMLNSGNNESAKKDSSNEVTFASIEKDVKSGGKLYDVRTAEEFESGHIGLATNWSLQDLQDDKLPSVAEDTKIYVYCRSGNRSGQATTILNNAGYTNVVDLHGIDNVKSLGGTLAAS